MRDTESITPAAEAAHFRDARSWEAEREAALARSEHRAWIVAGIACAVAVIAVIGLATLAPFRRTIPYLFAMDRATGNVEYVGAVDDRKVMGYQDLLDKHWAQRYIVARESYHYKLLQGDYDTVLGLSDESIGRDFARLYEGPNARDARLGANLEISTAVLSVQLSPNAVGSQAVVRFSKTTRRADTEASEPPQYFVATLAYQYQPTMTGKEKDLLANPLGFQVTSYRVDAELAPPAAAPQAASLSGL
ncbi:MAG: type IV secretion system protein [Pseudomonadota bacterium]